MMMMMMRMRMMKMRMMAKTAIVVVLYELSIQFLKKILKYLTVRLY